MLLPLNSTLRDPVLSPKLSPALNPQCRPELSPKPNEETYKGRLEERPQGDPPALPAVGSRSVAGTSFAQQSPKQPTQKKICDEIRNKQAKERSRDDKTDKHADEHAWQPDGQ